MAAIRGTDNIKGKALSECKCRECSGIVSGIVKNRDTKPPCLTKADMQLIMRAVSDKIFDSTIGNREVNECKKVYGKLIEMIKAREDYEMREEP